MATKPVLNTPNQRSFVSLTVTTAADGLSDVADVGGLTVSAIGMSTAWTDAGLSFLGSFGTSAGSSGNMQNLFTSTGGELIFTTSASRVLTFDPYPFVGLRFIQLRSGGSTLAVAQAAARVVCLSLASQQPIK